MNEEVKYLLLFAFKAEAQAFLKVLQRPEKISVGPFSVYIGVYQGQKISLVMIGCGAEKVQSLLSLIYNRFPSIDNIFNLGCAGALSDLYDIGDVLQVGAVFDPEFNFIENKFPLHNSFPVVRLYTSLKPVESKKIKMEIINKCDAELVDMEAAFILKNKGERIQLTIIKIISDRADAPIKQQLVNDSSSLSEQLEVAFKKIFSNYLSLKKLL